MTTSKRFATTLWRHVKMLPTRGGCHAVFLLNRTSQLKRCVSRASWVDSARQQTTILAGALDLNATAAFLIETRLVQINASVQFDHRFDNLWQQADERTLLTIAKIILETSPPAWLRLNSDDANEPFPYAPESDLRGLAWLGEFRDPLLLDVARGASRK